MGVDYNGVAGIGFEILGFNSGEEGDDYEYLSDIFDGTPFNFDYIGNGYSGEKDYYAFIDEDIEFADIPKALEDLKKFLTEFGISFEDEGGTKLEDYFYLGIYVF